MKSLGRLSRVHWLLVGAGSSIALLALVGACSIHDSSSDRSEIESYDAAVHSQTANGALAFINAHPNSHLVGDLIESLPPDVAAQVCFDMPNGIAGRVARSCQQTQDAVAMLPVAAPTPALAIAGPVISTTTGCAGVPPNLMPAVGNAAADVGSTTSRAAATVPIESLSAPEETAKTVVPPVQIAAAVPETTQSISRVEEAYHGRGGKAGEGGGGRNR
jgi:hypothetical protein